MHKRLIFVAGVGVGYILGTRAGRARFDRLVAGAQKVWENPTVQEAAGAAQAQLSRMLGTHAHPRTR